MSTWIYLQCADHNPPLVAPDESGQHLYDLPQIFADLRDRGRIVTNCHDGIFPDDYFRKHTAEFMAQHPQCRIEVWDENGRQHTDPNKDAAVLS